LATVNIANIEDTTICSHTAAYKFFIDSILNAECTYNAYPCNSKDEFDKGLCMKCGDNGCNKVGYYASKSKDTGRLYLNTQEAVFEPFCKHNYQIKLFSGSVQGQLQTKGKFTIYLRNTIQSTTIETLDDSDVTFKRNSVETRLLSFNTKFNGLVESAIISFRKTSNLLSSWMYDNSWSFSHIEVFDGANQILKKLCPRKQIIQSGESVDFLPCNDHIILEESN
jgi:lipoprotein lipase